MLSGINTTKEVFEMKKRITALFMTALLACSMLLTSCGSFDYAKEDLSKYIELGTYKGLKFEVAEVKPVDDEAVADYLEEEYADFVSTELQDADYVAKDGDTVNISYVGKIGGEAFEGGTAEKQDLKLGSDNYIDGFADGLVGAKAGDVKTLNLKFPADFGKDELNGKDVVFEVTVHSVSVDVYEYTKNITDATPLADGDNAVITYSLTVAGNDKFEKSGANAKITVGDEEDLDLPAVCTKALAGLKVGDKDKELKVTLPADYANADVAGKEATFVVTVVSATRDTTTDKIDDAMISTLTESADLAAYKTDVVIPALTKQFEREAKTANYTKLWTEVVKNSTVKSYPANELKRVTRSVYDDIAFQLGYYYKLSVREYAKQNGYKNPADFKEKVCKPQAEDLIKEELVLNAIIKAENITLTDEEILNGYKLYYEEYGLSSSYETFEDFKAAVDKGEFPYNIDFEAGFMWEKVVQTLLDSVAK